jgi:hypothetical protein
MTAMLQKIIILTSCLLLVTALQAHALQNSNPTDMEVTQKRAVAHAEENFRCFQNLNCLKRENPFPNSNLGSINLNHNRFDQYVVEGSSENGTMHAVYNNRGDLIKAKVIQRNVALPKAVADVLATGEFKEWNQVSNEVTVINFDRNQVQYMVILERNGELRIEYLNIDGEFLNRII